MYFLNFTGACITNEIPLQAKKTQCLDPVSLGLNYKQCCHSIKLDFLGHSKYKKKDFVKIMNCLGVTKNGMKRITNKWVDLAQWWSLH